MGTARAQVPQARDVPVRPIRFHFWRRHGSESNTPETIRSELTLTLQEPVDFAIGSERRQAAVAEFDKNPDIRAMHRYISGMNLSHKTGGCSRIP